MAKKQTLSQRLLAEVREEIREEDLAKKKALLKERLREIEAAEQVCARLKRQFELELQIIDERYN